MYTPEEKNAIERQESIVKAVTEYAVHDNPDFFTLTANIQKQIWKKSSAKYAADRLQASKDAEFTKGWELVVKHDDKEDYYLNLPPDMPIATQKIHLKKFDEANDLVTIALEQNNTQESPQLRG